MHACLLSCLLLPPVAAACHICCRCLLCETQALTHASACHFVLPCATDVVHACHSPCLANLLPQGCLPLHCLHLPFLPLPLALRKQKLRGSSETFWRSGAEQTLSNRGDARVLVSSEHEAASFTRGIKIPFGSDLG